MRSYKVGELAFDSFGDIKLLIELSYTLYFDLLSHVWLSSHWDAIGPSLNQRVMPDFL